jgi:outer membrane cobalamin receptor
VALTVQEYGPRGAVSQISLRGSTSEQVLVLLDGKRLNSPRSGGFNLSDLPVTLDQIERIEIVRGASSALYGADALGGVVNIITKKPERTQYSVSGSSGTHGYDALVASGSGRQGGLYYRFSGGRETYDGFRPNSDLDQKNVGAKIGYQVAPDSAIEITADYIGKEIGVPGSISCQSPLARQWNRDAVSGFGYKTKFSQAVEFNLNVDF